MAIERLFFSGEATARGELTKVSQKLDFKYKVLRHVIQFHKGAEDLLELSCWICRTATGSTPPVGKIISGTLGSDNHVVGNDTVFDFQDDYESGEWPSWIQVYANNTDRFPHKFNYKVIIERIT